MGYGDILIPFALGLFMIFGGNALVKPNDIALRQKKRRFRILGIVLLAVAALYLYIKLTRPICITC